MQFLGNKLSEAQTQMSGWMGNMRRSLQEAVELVSGSLERNGVLDEEEDEERMGRFERAISPLRSFASRGRQSLRNLSQQSRQRFSSLRKRTTTSESNNGELEDCEPEEDGVAEPDAQNLIEETSEQSENNDTVDDGSESRLNQALQRLNQARRRKTSSDSDAPDVTVHQEPEPLPVLESSAPPLDSSVLRSKVDLGKKRSIRRTRPTRAVRQRAALPALTEGSNPDWRFCDSTDAKDPCSNGGDSESEEELSQDATSSPAPSHPKRVPVFPGMDPSALMAQLKRRSGVVEAESPAEAQVPPAVPTRSPRTPTMALGPRVLPAADAKDSGSGSSPAWLLELKSKKRMSQPESDA